MYNAADAVYTENLWNTACTSRHRYAAWNSIQRLYTRVPACAFPTPSFPTERERFFQQARERSVKVRFLPALLASSLEASQNRLAAIAASTTRLPGNEQSENWKPQLGTVWHAYRYAHCMAEPKTPNWLKHWHFGPLASGRKQGRFKKKPIETSLDPQDSATNSLFGCRLDGHQYLDI